MASNYKNVVDEVSSWNLGVVHQDPTEIANVLRGYIVKGSSLHQLNSSEIVVYANPDGNFPGKQKGLIPGPDGRTIATNVAGLMAAGAKFFDSVFYLTIPLKDRPVALNQELEKDKDGNVNIPTYNNPAKLMKYLFAYYFFVMIRAHPPTDTGDYGNQPMPKFISTVLAMKENTAEIAEYLAEFDLSKLSPAWIKKLEIKNLSQESASRLGLGVAGYRLPSIFNLIIPDKYTDENIGEKPKWFDDSVKVARSFRSAGFCWDFHPATRNPTILAKYGNINRNITNLILEAYSEETIKMMIDTKKLAKQPIFDPAYTNYKSWTADMVYVATFPIFR